MQRQSVPSIVPNLLPQRFPFQFSSKVFIRFPILLKKFRFSTFKGHDITTVSYTHLDVYKRQVFLQIPFPLFALFLLSWTWPWPYFLQILFSYLFADFETVYYLLMFSRLCHFCRLFSLSFYFIFVFLTYYFARFRLCPPQFLIIFSLHCVFSFENNFKKLFCILFILKGQFHKAGIYPSRLGFLLYIFLNACSILLTFMRSRPH